MSTNEHPPTETLLARQLFDGTGAPVQRDMVVSIAEGRISGIAPYQRAEHGTDLPEHAIVTPGLIDIQINGANDVQFNDTPTVEGLRQIAIGAAQGGTAYILPTFVTAPGQAFAGAIDVCRAAIAARVPGILGLHLEGPFLSPKRPGIHNKAAIRQMESADVAALCHPFPGPLLLTLAPEEANPEDLSALVKAGVIVFAGHSEASSADMQLAAQHGLSGATHLFNAMSQISPRETGVVGAVLASDRLYAGIIADGHHVHWSNLALAIRLLPERLCLVTDAMLTLAGSLQEFDLQGERIFLSDGRLTNANGTLAGAHVAMDTSIQNVIDRGLASPELAVRMASRNPALAIGLGEQLGALLPGYRSSYSTFSADWQATGVCRA